jgi:CDP-6-deoxy-D-xylo-4-hexulose-3-dehydrase
MNSEYILDVVRDFINKKAPEKFVPGETYIRSSGASWNADDVAAIVEVALNRWYVDGAHAYEFEKFLANATLQRYAILCNSGSSANLLAISALMSTRLKDRAIKKGDEVITVACGFPTTVNPIIQNGLVPVFIDTNIPGYNALPHSVSEAITPKTKAIFMAHTLGNPYRAKEIRELADQNGLWVIADCCDALGAEHYSKPVPAWADISTFSFYPAHHISMGEGGAVTTDSSLLNSVIRSFRDWGRSSWCGPGKDKTCGKRFDWKLGDLPQGFDHKYIYSEVGYNLKATDLQAAVGLSQIKRLSEFTETRQGNWRFYRDELDKWKDYFILPERSAHSNPSWFGFVISVKENAGFSRNDFVSFLETNKIGTRMLFAGNLTRHPAYKDAKYRVSGTLHKSDFVMNQTLWIGVAPIITRPMQEYVVEKIGEFMKERG